MPRRTAAAAPAQVGFFTEMPSLESVWTVGLVKVLVLSKPSYEDLFKWVQTSKDLGKSASCYDCMA